jgi:hypothetical protein
MCKKNQVVIYSNGIADFQRCYEVGPESPEKISIPVRQDHLADVLASFNVYGNVKLDSPPTFRPSNELEGNITINPQKALEDLATNLSGAKVRVERASGAIEGTLVGLHQEEEATAGEPIHPKSIIVLTDEGLRRCVLREIQSFKFLDEDVQTEIDKALQRNYQRIKPNSTFVELVLSAAKDKSEAIVQYTIPAAAWKISYRLRMSEGRARELQGFAIVDNNTDEDWIDFHVCVVTGQPITFSTDLAESKTPTRTHVDLVSETALGAVEVEAPAFDMLAECAAPEGAEEFAQRSGDMLRKTGSRFSMAKRSGLDAAETTSAEIHEVGDFSIFESDSLVTIPAKRSTVIPVFNVEVADAKSVLHYKHENHPERPYRSVDFTNQTGFSLGRGVCTVFEEAAYSGNCIVPALKPDESRLLPHALETGVAVHRDQKRQRNKVVALRLSEGFCYTSTRQRRECHYHVMNSRNETYELVLDHDYTLSEPDIETRLVHAGADETLDAAKKLAEGARYSISVGPKSELIVKVVEQRIEQSQMELVRVTKQRENIQVDWLEQNLVRTNGPLAANEGVQECLKIHQQLEAKRQDISDAVNEIERLTGRQTRLRENIKSGGQDELTSRWRTELDEAEQAIREIEEQRLPGLRKKERSLQSKVRDALKSLSAEWSEEAR